MTLLGRDAWRILSGQMQKEAKYMGNCGESAGLDVWTLYITVYRWQFKQWTDHLGRIYDDEIEQGQV